MRKIFLLFIFFVRITPAAFSQGAVPSVTDTSNIRSALFESDELLNITLKFDISLYKRKKSDSEYLDGDLSYILEGDTIREKIKLRSRGIFRRNYCELPPIMLNFKKKDSEKGLFNHINKLKMVTQCPHGNTEYILREYLAYKLYSTLTDSSFRVRLARVTYVNTARKNNAVTEYAFFIEPEELLAKRMNSIAINQNVTQKQVRPEIMDRMAIFNYMIGNTDWSVPISHNIQLFSEEKQGRNDLAIIVPYDFDFSGFVYADYAAPFNGLKISSVRQRLYLGICREKDVLIKEVDEFVRKKPGLLNVIESFQYLPDKSKKDMTAYLESFYKEVSKPDIFAKTISIQCIKF
ncbi:MAG: hypothetical protein ACM3NR_01725 [Methanosarcina sp.]